MKKINFSKLFSAIFLLIFVVSFFVFSELVLSGARNGIDVCIKVIMPSLFPFLIISAFFVKSGLSDCRNKFAVFIAEKIFSLQASALPVFLMSLIGGFPVGIRMINELYNDKKISEKQAERLSLFCVNAGPAFVINAVGVTMLSSKKAGLIIFFSLSFSSILIAFFSQFFYRKEESKIEKNRSGKSFSQALVESVSDSISALFSICGWIIFISAFLPLIDNMNSAIVKDFLKAFSEVTSGAVILSKKYPMYTLAGIIGFNGLCVHCQLLPNLNKMKIRLPVFFLGRILSAILSLLISKILFVFFPCDIQTFSTLSEVTYGGLSVSIPTVTSLFFMCGLLILDLSLDRSKKIC